MLRHYDPGVTDQKLLLMADWAADPVWERDDETGRAKCMLPLEALPLGPALAARLRGWARTHDEMFDPPDEDVEVDPDRLSAWVEEGRELLPAMRTELGDGFDVRYHLDATA
jgi:hypothetical protein